MKADDAAEWLENAAIDRGQSVFNDCADAIRTLIAERDDLQRALDLSWAAQMRAIAAWQERHDEPLTWPDHERLVLWLMEERERLREALMTFRNYGCPICYSDCAAASPPVLACPMEMARAALETKP